MMMHKSLIASSSVLLKRCQSRRSTTSACSTKRSFAPEDTKRIFAHKSTLDLFVAASLYKLASYKRLVSLVSSLLSSSPSSSSSRPTLLVSRLLRDVIRRIVFPVFVSGSSIHDCRATSDELFAKLGVKTILDHNVEESDGQDAWDENLNQKLLLLDSIGRSEKIVAVPFKITSLFSPLLLEKMTSDLDVSDDGSSGKNYNGSKQQQQQQQLQQQVLYESCLSRIEQLCRRASELNLSLMLDAEQSNRQPAIEVIANYLASKYNVNGKVVVYNTYQTYLKRTPNALKRDLEAARKGNYVLAVKLVRGAYSKSEKQRALDLGCELPLVASKQEADKQYEDAIRLLLHSNSSSSSSTTSHQTTCRVVLATHNRQSVEYAVTLMEQLSMPRSHESVEFATIAGMSDNITFSLGLGGYNARKLLSFGTFEDVLPWLLRRLDENQDALGAMQHERLLLNKELLRRAGYA